MSKLYLSILSTLTLTVSLCAQITITNSVFPEPGDTLASITAGPLAVVPDNITTTDIDVFWNLENLPAGVPQVTVFRAAAEGSSAEDFPDAELVATALMGAGETYYDVFNNRIDEVGRGNQDFGFGEIEIPLSYDEVPVYARAPISFGDVFEDLSSGSITAPSDIIPDSLTASLPISFDSVRVTLETVTQSAVDSWGSVSIPGGVFPVLRERVEGTTTTTLFIYSFLGWSEVDQGFLSLLGPLGDFFGEQNFVTYNFLSDSEKEPILSVTYDDEETLTNVTYKDAGIISDTKELTYTSAEIRSYPNPTLGDITFDVGAFGPGSYDITIYSIVGTKLMDETIEINNGSTYSTNLGHLRKGTYIYTVHDQDGLKLGTKRFIVLKP